MTLIGVTGGRSYNNRKVVTETLQALIAQIHDEPVIVQGGATGADAQARIWARKNGIHTLDCEALWGVYGNSAGPRRNAIMAKLPLQYLVAFPGNAGTADMVERCRRAGIEVIKP